MRFAIIISLIIDCCWYGRYLNKDLMVNLKSSLRKFFGRDFGFVDSYGIIVPERTKYMFHFVHHFPVLNSSIVALSAYHQVLTCLQDYWYNKTCLSFRRTWVHSLFFSQKSWCCLYFCFLWIYQYLNDDMHLFMTNKKIN